MQIPKGKTQYIPGTILIIVALFVWGLISSDVATADVYTDSAHGNTSYGVKRKGTTGTEYTIGACAHCHDTFDRNICGVNPLMLFAPKFNTLATQNPYEQSNNFCFYCHYGDGTYQEPDFSNCCYSITFGGNSDITPATIFDAFNCSSYHNLNDVLNFAKGEWPTFTADSNPCSACHNVHMAKQNRGAPGDPTYTAISRPSEHSNLWGDGTSPINERMDRYTTYVAPFYVGANPTQTTTQHEPDGRDYDQAGANGSNVPDYVIFCTDCHNESNSIYSATLGRVLSTIDWASEEHGQGNDQGGQKGDRTAPYTEDGTRNTGEKDANFVLSCMDCHEPHGSASEYLLRTQVNGLMETTVTDDLGNSISARYGGTTNSVAIEYPGEWVFFCSTCHDINPHGGDPHGGDGHDNWRLDCGHCHSHGNKF